MNRIIISYCQDLRRTFLIYINIPNISFIFYIYFISYFCIYTYVYTNIFILLPKKRRRTLPINRRGRIYHLRYNRRRTVTKQMKAYTFYIRFRDVHF